MHPDLETSGTPTGFKLIGVALILAFGILYFLADQAETNDRAALLARTKQATRADYQVEGAQIIPGAVTELKGAIRNMGPEPIRGYVTIQVLNFTSESIGSFKAFLNDQKQVLPGESGTFSYHVASHKVTGGTKLAVTFHSL